MTWTFIAQLLCLIAGTAAIGAAFVWINDRFL